MFRSRDMGRAVAVRRWTPTALDCYKRGCNCEGCFYKDFFSGTPNIELQQFINEAEEK